MKIRNIISATIMGVVLASTPVYADYVIPAKTITELNVRQYPSKDAAIIDTLPEGQYVAAMDSGNPDWNRVDFGGYTGYVYNAYLIATEEPILTNGTTEDEVISVPKAKTVEDSVASQEELKLTRVIALDDFRYAGVVNWNGWNWTYYLMSMFPGSTSTPVEGRWVNDEGFVCDNEGYIILASADLAPYTVVETPFGYMGKVYDTGCPHGTLDVYTNW